MPRPDSSRQGAIESEGYLSISQAAKLIPSGRAGKPVHAATVARWILDGSTGPSGRRIRLRAARLGSRWLTTRAWLDDFATELAAAEIEARGDGPSRTPTAQSREARRASAELDRLGI